MLKNDFIISKSGCAYLIGFADNSTIFQPV